MLRTKYQEQDIILRIKRNLMLYSLTDEMIYEGLLNVMDTIYQMDTFALVVDEKYWIVGDTQRSAYPLITVQNIIPVQNVLSL
ncbi:hypothetical protein [Sutcliffiella halmapala]|uniref:hypothetical protein n=1 Tax=Sutcliffiella halmapala TaxID=79882 RepID=UPI000994F9D4|nr:hypothetical protein [Sutcliffiella halmapala]